MPSAFPGMDPYLEHPTRFPDLHDRLITYLGEAIQEQLPEPYYVRLGRRAWVEISQRSIGPDLELLRPRGPDAPARAGGGTAVLERAGSRSVVVRMPMEEFREPFLELYAAQPGGAELVTSLELLSPTNKQAGAQGRELYLRKQREILASRVNLVEIDLLRGGTHSTAVPWEQARAGAGAFDYHVCVWRWDQFDEYEVYPIQLADPLPVIGVPLRTGDGQVEADLQALFSRCWHAARYDREIDYASDLIEPPLTPEQADWVRKVVLPPPPA